MEVLQVAFRTSRPFLPFLSTIQDDDRLLHHVQVDVSPPAADGLAPRIPSDHPHSSRRRSRPQQCKLPELPP
eukprot:11774719-Heterocapsa_arctica.AAC.1